MMNSLIKIPRRFRSVLARLAGMVCLRGLLLLTTIFFFVSNYGLSQDSSLIITLCKNAKGTRMAEGELERLKKMNPDMPSLREAISSCEARFQELRLQEEILLNKARENWKRGECVLARAKFQDLYQNGSTYQDEARDQLLHILGSCPQVQEEKEQGALDELKRAEHEYKAGYLDQADRRVGQYVSWQGEIGAMAKDLRTRIEIRKQNISKFDKTRRAIAANQLDKACDLLSDIETADPSFSGFDFAKAQANGCPDIKYRKLYQRANDFINRREWQKAQNVLDNIELTYKDVKQLKERIAEEVQREAQSAPCNTILERATRRQKDGWWQEAKATLDNVRNQCGSNPAWQNRAQQIEISLQEEADALNAAIDLLNKGQRPQAREKLAAFIHQRHSRPALAKAHFWLGWISATEYYVSSEKSDEYKAEAKRLFTEALKENPAFVCPSVAPKIKTLYDEATAQLS